MGKAHILGLFDNSRRLRTLITLGFCSGALALLFGAGIFMNPAAYDVNFSATNLPPSMSHFFGTDWMGRDMLARTVKGLSVSLLVGIAASAVSAVMAVILGTMAATLGRRVDAFITWLIDLFMSVPHIITIMLISIAVGKGLVGVLVGVAATHWTSLARVIRAEVMALRSENYIAAARAMGRGPIYIAGKHMLPHILPQFLVGLVLLFPHAILHEAAVTFLGFGLPPEQPAVGIILSEAMRFLSSGQWWLAVFPGASLLAVVLMLDSLGENIKALADPASVHE